MQQALLSCRPTRTIASPSPKARPHPTLFTHFRTPNMPLPLRSHCWAWPWGDSSGLLLVKARRQLGRCYARPKPSKQSPQEHPDPHELTNVDKDPMTSDPGMGLPALPPPLLKGDLGSRLAPGDQGVRGLTTAVTLPLIALRVQCAKKASCL